MDGLEGVSLLWPPGHVPGAADPQPRLTAEQAADLELDILVNALCLHPSDKTAVQNVLLHLCTDPSVIAFRQGVLESIAGSAGMSARLEGVLPRIDRLRQHHVPREKGELLHEVAWRLGELEIFLECVTELGETLDSAGPRGLSEGLAGMREALSRLTRSETVHQLMQELPGLIKEVRGTRSLTLGVNVDPDLQPASAVLLSINRSAFDDASPSFLARLFGKGGSGIAPLHRAAETANPMLQPLFRDLSDALSRTLRPVAAALQRFMGVHTQFLDQWGQEISFYLGAARLARRLRGAGLPLCRPQVSAPGTDGCSVEGSYNIALALKLAERGGEEDLSRVIVSNDLAFGPHEVTILTGPNQGGKTTYMRSIGLVHVLCQAGLPVPGRSARVSAVDSIHTHFPRAERADLESGRFADEMRRLRDIFAHATPASLILLNESLTATSARESLELAREVVGALQVLGARAVYTTHLYELAAEADDFNARTAGPGRVGSLVARPGGSFRIEPGPPAGSSHAREVAARFGVSYEQLVDVLRGRKIVP